MTRYLSRLLGAVEPTFSLGLRELEQAAGRPSADIRLTSDLMQRTRAKIAELGLDPQDTSGPELYEALMARLQTDEAKVRETLGIVDTTPAQDVLVRVQQVITARSALGNCFALKTTVVKRLFKAKPPKAAMKHFGYRSLDSMLKHEPVAQIYAAALIAESTTWHRHFRDQYMSLQPGDFESRKIVVLHPQAARWQKLAAGFVQQAKHPILSFPELGTIVMLPLPAAIQIDGLAITSMLLVLDEMNTIRSHSSYLKLQQVKPDFGKILRQVSESEPYTAAQLAGQPVPWSMVQRYYARNPKAYHPEVFEPHVQPEDLAWHHGEDMLAKLEPALAFWQGTQWLGLLHEGKPVSCNALDVALNYCNKLPFAQRVAHFVRGNLWHELMLRYLDQSNLETAVHQQLSNELSDGGLALAPEVSS